MAALEPLDARHAPALLQFELDNREFFARWIPETTDEIRHVLDLTEPRR